MSKISELTAVSAVGYADILPVVQNGTTKSTTVALLRQMANVKDYGAVGDGSTDDTSAIQAAITANYGKVLYFPAGTYAVTALTVTSSIHFHGDGQEESGFTWLSTTASVFTITSANAVHFSNLFFTGPASATSGFVISLSHSASGVNYFSSFTECTFTNGYDQIRTVSAAAFLIRDCYFNSYVRRAITVQSANTPDAGDSRIYGNTFANAASGAVGIYQVSSGGLKVTGNKFNGSGARAYQMQLASGVTTSILIFANNSVENQVTDAMKFATDGGGATFSQVVITGNQFALEPYGIDMSGATAFISGVSIVGNTFALNASGTYGINMANINRYLITGNTFFGGGGTPTGILLAASCSNGQLGPNNFVSITTPINDSSTSKAKIYFTDTSISTNGVQFPATQVASSDVNCFDDYEENPLATPLALTFATPGDLSVAYTTQVTQYIKKGKEVTVWFNIVTSTFTHTTASGSLQLTGLPFTVATITDYNFVEPLGWSGLNLQAGYTSVGTQVVSGGTNLIFYASGDNVAGANITTTEAATGSTIVLRGKIVYIASA